MFTKVRGCIIADGCVHEGPCVAEGLSGLTAGLVTLVDGHFLCPLRFDGVYSTGILLDGKPFCCHFRCGRILPAKAWSLGMVLFPPATVGLTVDTVPLLGDPDGSLDRFWFGLQDVPAFGAQSLTATEGGAPGCHVGVQTLGDGNQGVTVGIQALATWTEAMDVLVVVGNVAAKGAQVHGVVVGHFGLLSHHGMEYT